MESLDPQRKKKKKRNSARCSNITVTYCQKSHL